MKILYWLYKSKANKKNEAPIKMRITLNGERIDFSTKIEISEQAWDKARQRVVGKNETVNQYNNILQSLKSLAWEYYHKCLNNRKPITLQDIKNYILCKDFSEHTLIEAFDYQIGNLKARVGNDIALNTVKKYLTSKKKVLDYLAIELNRLGMDAFMRSKLRLKHNAVVKNMQQLRRVIKVALENEWITKDPFTNYSCAVKETDRECLTKEELEALEKVVPSSERLEKVRDIFLLCCYTGLAYADVSKLSASHLVKGVDGNTWIILARTKTKTQSTIPLIPQAIGILEKYSPGANYRPNQTLLPVISNQNLNKYIKEVAAMAGIRKHVTFHLARHTFATTITLNKGVDIVTVSKMLGHKNLRTTQVYAKVNMLKISEDMKKLM